MERIITIDLFGEQYRFKSDTENSDPEEIAKFLVEEVEKAGKMIENNNTQIMKFAQLLLATLNISSQYFELQNKYSALTSSLNERAATIIDVIEKNVPG